MLMPTLAQVHQKLLACDLARLPLGVQASLLQRPMLSVPVVADGAGFVLAKPELLARPAPAALLPKLGLKSWRDGGSLGVLYAGVEMKPLLQTLLQHPTRPQRLVASAWSASNAPLPLHLLPWMDFSEVSESRWLAGPGQVRCVSVCLRGASAAQMGTAAARILAQVQALVPQLPPHSHLFDFACLPDGRIGLVELNPGLSPAELKLLQASV